MKRLLHFLFGCHCDREAIMGWTYFGNPVWQCEDCGQWFVTYGITFPHDYEIDERQARNLIV